MELIPVIQETVRGTDILWDGIPKVFYLLGVVCLESDISAYRRDNGPYLYGHAPEEKDRLIKWLQNRIAQLKLIKLMEGD